MRLSLKSRAKRSRLWLALAAAIVLLVQTFGAAYATGLGSRPVLLDAFGNPLCITSGEHGGAGDGARHGRLTDCCALACVGIAGADAPPPQAPGAAAPDARLVAFAHGRILDEQAPQAFGTPTNPRAPPAM